MIFSNYSYERNEPSLFTDGFTQKPRNREQEKTLITNFLSTPDPKAHLVIVMGGFMDNSCAYCYSIHQALVDFYKNNECHDFHFFYREHNESEDIVKLVKFYGQYNKKIILIGHSWGACSLVKNVAESAKYSIDLLVTIDPVGARKPAKQLPLVKKWVNIFVDYKKANWNRHNIVARAGHPWHECEGANSNILSETPYHHRALAMFEEYAFDDCKQIMLD